MTITATYREEYLGHDDASVRVLHLSNGITMTVALNPDTSDDYCLDCDRMVLPLAEVTVIDSEQWDYPANGHEGQSICPVCLGTDMTTEDDAERIRAERAADDEADRRYRAWKDDGYGARAPW